MHESDLNRVRYFSNEDMAGGYELSKAEIILRSDLHSDYTDINDILEFYNIIKYIDNKLYLTKWTSEDIEYFTQKTDNYRDIIGKFMSNINSSNMTDIYEKTSRNYTDFFWELINDQKVFKNIQKNIFNELLLNEPQAIHEILKYKNLVDHYDNEIKNFLLTYTQAAEILLSINEEQNNFQKNQRFIPKCLTLENKEDIIIRYLNSENLNLNYIRLIQNIRNDQNFKISDKTRLKAKHLHKSETEKYITEKNTIGYGVAISFQENVSEIKYYYTDSNHITHFIYSLDIIKQNPSLHILFQNFKYLFEYVDNQNRITLVSKKRQLGIFERMMRVYSQNEYIIGYAFSFTEMTSHAQISGYNNIIKDLDSSIEGILKFVYTSVFKDKYKYANNAHFSIPTATTYFEKIRLLAPEFESILKQFKLFVENGVIDYELLQISSSPSSIKGIPSLNLDKYFYLNEENKVICGCMNLLFSDQTLLTYVDPYKEKYSNFFELIYNEKVEYSKYENHQKQELTYLIDNNVISIDNNNCIQINNPIRLLILNDLYFNEVCSYYHFSDDFKNESKQMEIEKIIYFDNSLFSKPEQSYFNFILNQKEFTNGLDLRNSYLHGTQASPDDVQKHEYYYLIYLKLLILLMLKIEDDLIIANLVKKII